MNPDKELLETVNRLLWRYETDENYTVRAFTQDLWDAFVQELIDQEKAEAWDEGFRDGFGDGLGTSWSAENPYREETA